jgi:uncharacterized protein (DUF302 family)
LNQSTTTPPSAANYGFHCTLKVTDFAQAVTLVTEALKTEGFGVLTDIGLLLPCNVVVREDTDGQIVVGFMDPVAVLQLTRDPGIGRIAHEVRERLERVRSVLIARPAGAIKP